MSRLMVGDVIIVRLPGMRYDGCRGEVVAMSGDKLRARLRLRGLKVWPWVSVFSLERMSDLQALAWVALEEEDEE